MAWTDKYVDLSLPGGAGTSYSAGGSGAAGTWATNVLTPAVAPGWGVDVLIGKTVTTSAGTFTITDNNATTLTVTAIGADPADGASGAWRIGVGSTSDPWASYGGAVAGLGSVSGPMRVYVRGNQTLDANLALSTVGTSANPVTWVGCTGTGTTWTRIGDAASTTKPTLTCSTYTVTAAGDYQIFEGLAFTGAPTAALFTGSGANQTFVRCRFTNTGTNAASYALSMTGNYDRALFCYFNASTNTADYAFSAGGLYGTALGCVATGGDVACIQLTGSGASALFNICYGGAATTNGIRSTNVAGGFIICNTVYACQEDGIEVTQGYPVVFGNLIHGGAAVTDYPINYSNATASHQVITANNAWYNCANDKINGIVETQATHGGPTLDFGNMIFNYGNTAPFDSDPLPAASVPPDSATDFVLAAAHKALLSITYEAGDYAYVSYLDHGAVQRQESAAGGGSYTFIGG